MEALTTRIAIAARRQNLTFDAPPNEIRRSPDDRDWPGAVAYATDCFPPYSTFRDGSQAF
jgi:hypothetical protein